MSKTLKELTKDSYSPGSNSPTAEELKLGCLQRIADATEVMAQNYAAIIKAKESAEKDRDRYWKYYTDESATTKKLRAQISALRGVITKLKKQKEE